MKLYSVPVWPVGWVLIAILTRAPGCGYCVPAGPVAVPVASEKACEQLKADLKTDGVLSWGGCYNQNP